MKLIAKALGRVKLGKQAYAVLALCAATAMAVSAQTFTALYSFDIAGGAQSDALVQGAAGNFYATTAHGGCPPAGSCGTVFKITPSGALTTL